MIFRLAIRSLATRPIRTAVLACGFGFGIAVMAALLGVGAVILEQAHSPALAGGGDLVILGRFGAVDSARFVMTSVLGATDLAQRTTAVSPSKTATLYLMTGAAPIEVDATGVVPSLERAVGGKEIAHLPGWVDTPADRAWSSPAPGDVMRAMDRFHPIPATPEFAASWAEWLYFNGHTADGTLRFYITFLVGPASAAPGGRIAGVRLQLQRDGKTTTYSVGAEIDGTRLLETAPDLDIAGNRVRLEGLRYRIELALPGAAGELTLDAVPGRSLPPATLRGARGWLTGYTAPVLAGTVHGTLTVGGDRIVFDNVSGYHDHNWGFWKGVSWQWGQVAQGDVSIIYGRVFPPADVADAERVPGFLGVLGAQGPLGFSTTVSIDDERGSEGRPDRVLVHARGRSLNLRLTFAVDRSVRTAMSMMQPGAGPPLDFLQLAGEYTVSGKVGDRQIDFTARGAAETFRPR
jgi:hypothetical protein